MMKYLLLNKQSERIQFRPIEEVDFDDWLPFFHNEHVKNIFKFPDSSPEELCIQWFERQFFRYENDLGGFNALIDKTTGKLLGHCGLLIQEIDNITELEIGYSLLPDYWGKGYALEAAKFCKDSAFENQWAKSLISIITHENKSSISVAKRNGLEYEKDSVYKGFDVGIWRVWAP